MRDLRTAGKSVNPILLKNGRVIDPYSKLNRNCDILIVNGFIQDVDDNIAPPPDSRIIDVSDCIVTPGLVDIHTHLYHTGATFDSWAGELSVDPDAFSFRSGVTAMVDAGSAGPENFNHFRETVIDRVKTRVYAFVNITRSGMRSELEEQDPANFVPEDCITTAKNNNDVVVGFKSAHYRAPDWKSVDAVLTAGRGADLPVMIDFGFFQKERPYWELVCEKLRPGDISTHCYRGPVPVVDENGLLYEYLFWARKKGIRFDLGHGGGSFLFRNVVPAVSQGFPPDTISTDLHMQSINLHMIDLQTTMSKLLAVGMSLEDIIERTTVIPAQIIGKKEIGTLAPGKDADIALFKLESGSFGFSDSQYGYLEGTQSLRCEATLRGGEIVWDVNARFAVDYRQLPDDCGTRKGKEFFIRPPRGYSPGAP